MPESNHLKLRTTIMVASMIALPLAAVIGFKWPKFLAAEKTTASRPARSPESEKSTAHPAPEWNGPTDPTAAAGGNGGMVIPAGGINNANNPNNQVALATNNDVRPTSGLDVPLVSPVTPVAHVEEVRPLPTPSEAGEGTDPFLQIQQRLRSLGAIHYSLETWGPQGEAYRFQCRMAAGHNPNYSRHFEATDVDPLRVMQTVLNDVEAWKSGRLP